MSSRFIGSRSSGKVLAAATITSVGLFVVNYVPHTFGIQYYKKFLHCYKNGEPVTLSEKILKRFDRAAELCELKDYERKLVTPFSVVGFDVSSAGSTKSHFGAIVGVPTNYEYDSSDDIRRNDIRCRDQNINWNSEGGKLLSQSLVLTEDEQVFGLCRALLHLNTFYVLKNSVFPSLSFLMVYTVGRYLNLSLGLLAKPFAVRLIMYTILGLFGFGSWCFLKDFNQLNTESDVDNQLSALGPQFVQAGISYYDKQLKKNMALRDLLKDNTYTAKGNVNYLIRQKSLPLTIRKSFFESKLENVEN